MKIVVRPDPGAVAAAAAEMIGEELAVPGPATLGLAGGSTPAALYTLLAAADIDWDGVTLWLGDERWIPEDHPDSNASMARSRLGADAGGRLVAPVYGDDPAAAAAGYDSALRDLLAPTGGVPGTVLLGMGADGHTASLFPGTAALAVSDRWYVANRVHDTWRLTATVPLLASARHLVFLVTGAGKAGMIAEILDGAARYPARIVAEQATKVTWLLAAAAAAQLGER